MAIELAARGLWKTRAGVGDLLFCAEGEPKLLLACARVSQFGVPASGGVCEKGVMRAHRLVAGVNAPHVLHSTEG